MGRGMLVEGIGRRAYVGREENPDPRDTQGIGMGGEASGVGSVESSVERGRLW